MHYLQVHQKVFLATCLLVAVAQVGPVSAQSIISVNISGSDRLLTAGQSAGAIPAVNWNNAGVDGGGGTQTFNNLTDNTGAATETDLTLYGVDFTYNNSTDISGSPIPEGDALMMSSSRGRSGSGSRTFDVSNVGFDLYDVYVYFGGVSSSATKPYTIDLTLQEDVGGGTWSSVSPTYYMVDSNSLWDGTYNQSLATAAVDAEDGFEYVRFQNVSLDKFRLLTSSVGRRAGFSGIQIVQVPEPGAALLGSLALGLVTLRRSRRAELS